MGGATGGVRACVCVCVCGGRVSVAGMGKLDLFFSWGEEREDGGGLRGSVMAPHCILYIYRWEKMKMFSE